MVFLKRFLLLALLASIALGALPAGTVFEVRTAGADPNGGCYVTGSTGTDFSQQNAAQYSATDLVLVTASTVSSVSHLFIASDVGNCLHQTAGTNFTVGFYQIVSVAAGVATLDRVAGTSGATGGTFAVGGAILSPVLAAANIQIGNQIWLKNDGTYTITATIALANGGNNTALPVGFRGYTTTRGDSGRAIITTATNATPMLTYRDWSYISNLTLSNTAGTRSTGMSPVTTSQGLIAQNITLTGFSSGISSVFAVNNHKYFNIEIVSSTGNGYFHNTNSNLFGLELRNCWIHLSGGVGIELDATQGNNIQIIGTAVTSNTGAGMNLPNLGGGGNPNDNGLEILNSVVAYNGGNGLSMPNTTRTKYFSVVNSVWTSNTTFDINLGIAPYSVLSSTNAFRESNNNFPASPGDVTLTADPFTSTTNLTPNATAGGGAALKNVGFPGITTFGTGFAAIGTLQPLATAGASYGFAN